MTLVAPDAVDEAAPATPTRARSPGSNVSSPKADLEGKFMAIAATDETEVNIGVYEAAERRAMLVNVVDVPSLCNFILPAIVRKRAARDPHLDRRRLAGAGEADEARDRGPRSASTTPASR